jgi:hypothetical protein
MEETSHDRVHTLNEKETFKYRQIGDVNQNLRMLQCNLLKQKRTIEHEK